MNRIAIIGAGGQCRAVLAILSTTNKTKPECIYDTGKWRNGEVIMGIPVLPMPPLNDFASVKDEISFILAIGDNLERKKWYIQLSEKGYSIQSVVSPLTVISDSAIIGHGVVIAPNVFVGPETQIGNNVILNTGSIIEHESIVGDHCHLAPGSVMCGRTKIGDLCFLGARATVIDKLNVADENVIGAGSVVIRSILDIGNTWVGVPAKKLNR